MDTDEHDTLSASELDRIEKAIFEVARQQRGKRVPVSLPFPDFWDRAVHLVIHLEQEADRMRREGCLLYTSPSPRDKRQSRMPSSA